ncbi:phage tail tape measure protein [Pseudomonas sp. MSSRFD41]|uniref:phage tail tape measure protein n=1 Tax=Pseudomonas sp. MSSRFD41 TaxID=1310370 RepID=UPI00163A0731|nr:phage tail tape measure protein [Pseudomonas sp. MSSRFD41]MBC2655096.1 phage tail tape measure protein [Pseudomonas sp. MSSRFD41]
MADRFQLKALITGVDKLSPVLTGIRKNAANLRKQLNSSGLGKITFGDAIQGGAIAAPFVMGVRAAIKLESAMADVKKVVKFDTPEQFQAMNTDVLNLSERLPMAADGIAKIVAAGGQSGIERNDLMRFAEDAVKMGVAFDQTAEQSGEMMAKWRTAFRMNQDEVVALADQINYLGNTGPATTAQISSIITEVGALGEVAGLSSAQVAAIGATMAGVGVKQDVAATGIKNFMLAMTKGSAATKSQAQAFKALRLDSKQVAVAMQKDSKATLLDLLKRISEVDAAKRPALLTNLFGSESVSAITPLVTNLELLKGNLTKVGDAEQYGGSMLDEYTSRAATTENSLQLLQNRVTRLGITVGNALLPPLNDFVAVVGPIVSKVAEFAGANPMLVKGILGAAVGFTALRLAAAGATAVLTIMNGVAMMSPVGLIVRGIAIAAGVLIANWSTVGPYFVRLWEQIKGPALMLWGWFKQAFRWTPLGLIAANWGQLIPFCVRLWEQVKAPAMAAWEFLKAGLSWTPIGMVIQNWGPLVEFFSALWELIKAFSVPIIDYMKHMFDWTPLGLIVKHWAPITQFFQDLWNDLKPIIEPMMNFFGVSSDGDGVISAASSKIRSWAEQQNARNGEGLPAPGQLVKPIAAAPELLPQATQVASLLRAPANDGALLRAPGAGQGSGSLPAGRGSLIQQTAASQRTELTGAMVVRFENAPAGMRADPAQTNQPGLSVSPQVGYRSLGR